MSSMSKGVSEMIIQKPNCGNCTKCPFLFGTHFEDRLNNPIYEIVKHTGCLDHPNAREYLNAGVISYLEQYLITETFGGYSETDVAYSKLARETIALIRDGDFEKKDPSDVKGQLIHQSNEWKVYKQDALRIIRAVDERVGYGWQ